MREYDLNVPGLDEAVAACKPDKGHKALVIVMPEHDYGVQRTWRGRTYGF